MNPTYYTQPARILQRYFLLFVLSILAFGLFVGVTVNAAEDPKRMWLPIDQPTIERGYTGNYDDGSMLVGVLPHLVNEPVFLDMKRFSQNELPVPDGMRLVSDYYIYDILRQQQTSDPLILNKPFHIALKFDSGNLWRKRVFFWTGSSEGWRALPSSIDYANGYVRAISHLPFSRVAVFEDEGGTEGYASWLRWTSRSAASNDFPMGTKLRVRSVDSGKTVDVTVRSTGPFTPFEYRRVVDLSYDAFQAIANPSAGTTRVQVWRLDEAAPATVAPAVQVLGTETSTPSSSAPKINSLAAIAVNEDTGEVVFEKNADQRITMASLTKIVTALVVLDTNPDWERKVAYSSDDNAIGAKLYNVRDGEQMTVRDLFYTSLVGSANNATKTLARSTGLSTEEFVSRMNAKVRSLGLTQTELYEVTGLDERNATTAREYAVIAKHALRHLPMLQATTARSYSFTTSLGTPHTIVNRNQMVNSSWYLTGGKTGYLNYFALMTRARRNRDTGPNVITVILDSNSDAQRYAETNALLEYAFSRL